MAAVLSINSNLSSLQAQRRLAQASGELSGVFSKLSSGLRITTASDDAAGLAIASSLSADMRVYSQGVRNFNDGISFLNVADGALSQLSMLTTRMRELAQQSANGTLGWKQRESIDEEAQALSAEYFRIAQTTKFNGIAVFDGTLGALRLQGGYGTNGGIAGTLGGAMGDGTFAPEMSYAAETLSSSAVALSDLNGDGNVDLVTTGWESVNTGYMTVRLGNGDGSFGKATSYTAASNSGTEHGGLVLADINDDGIMDALTAGSDATGGFVSIRLGNGDGTFRKDLTYRSNVNFTFGITVNDINHDGILDFATAEGEGTTCTRVRLGIGDGTFGNAVTYAAPPQGTRDATFGDVNNDGNLDLVSAGKDTGGDPGLVLVQIGKGDGTFGTSVSYVMEGIISERVEAVDLNHDGNADLLSEGWAADGKAYLTTRLGAGNGTFGSAVSFQVGAGIPYALSVADLNGDGNFDAVASGPDGRVYAAIGRGDGTFGHSVSFLSHMNNVTGAALADLNNDGVLDLATAGQAGGAGRLHVQVANTHEGVNALLPFSLGSKAGALQSIPLLDRALERISAQRGVVGAMQSRVRAALGSLGTAVENYNAARSRIQDADIAQESAALVRNQILQQSAASVLSQANQGPALALRLLQG